VAAGLTYLFLASCPAAVGAGGPELPPAPIPLRILAPVHGLFYQFTPDAAGGVPAGREVLRVELSESNVLQFPKGFPAQVEPLLDFEVTRLQVSYERGITDAWDLGIEVPFTMLSDGWMDGPILAVEQFFDKVKPRRRNEDPYSFAYQLSRNGETILTGDDGTVRLGDVGLTTRYVVDRGTGGRPTVALRGALKLPTGDRDHAVGSGTVDVALGLVADWHVGRWSLWSSGSLTVPLGDVRDTPGFDTEPVGAGYLELGYSLSRRTRLQCQLAFQSGPFDLEETFPETGLPVGPDGALTHHIAQVTPAVSRRLGDGRTLFVGVVQDIHSSERSASDATVFAVLKMGLR
jgi:hypothetical protein